MPLQYVGIGYLNIVHLAMSYLAFREYDRQNAIGKNPNVFCQIWFFSALGAFVGNFGVFTLNSDFMCWIAKLGCLGVTSMLIYGIFLFNTSVEDDFDKFNECFSILGVQVMYFPRNLNGLVHIQVYMNVCMGLLALFYMHFTNGMQSYADYKYDLYLMKALKMKQTEIAARRAIQNAKVFQ
jgi:hypothetical protein